MNVFVCTVLLALLQANLGVHSMPDTQNAASTQPAAPTVALQSTPTSSPPVKGDTGNSREGGKDKSVSVAVQTPPKFYKPKTSHDKSLAFYKTVIKIMERLSEAFHKIYRDVEKFKRHLKPSRI
ncbi:unnamed protein product [Trichobilharzia szidati]|nr:unnamed protein product [Trichobilharzia szidati]